MQRSLSVVLYILGSLLITSCSKVDSLFNNGEPITVQREMDQVFHSISMYNNVNVKLVHDNHPHLELTCPENLIEKVTTVVEDGVLTVKNENDYNWLRSYDYSIDLTIYYDSISTINYASVGDLFSTDTIRGYGKREIDTTESGFHTLWTRSFYININEGCGDIDLAVKCNVFKTDFNNGTSEGKPKFLYTSTIHGDETTGWILMLRLIDYLLENPTLPECQNILENIDLYICPNTNPDGTYHGGNNTVNGATRANANGIDMNRKMLSETAIHDPAAFTALGEGLAGYSRGLTVEDGNGLDGRSGIQGDSLAIERALC